MENATDQNPLIGVIIGNYQIKAKLGAGGMGTVYLAEHPLIGKQVALKVLHAEHSADRDVVARFFHEARAVNDIKHPNIVDIIDFGVIAGQGRNVVYLLMELLEGVSLAGLLRQETALPQERAFGIAWQIADALSASHAAGIIHRDLKPDNVMLLQRGRQRDFVKVLDFGIAKLTGNQSSHHTRTGVIIGTPAYMSPEQCEGRSDIDHRTDIYSLGVLLYQMLTGQVPFHGQSYGQVLAQHLMQRPAPPSSLRAGISPHAEAVVMKALEKKPDARYASMDEFMKALDDPAGYVEAHGGLAGFLASAAPPGAAARPVAWGMRGPTMTLTPAPLVDATTIAEHLPPALAEGSGPTPHPSASAAAATSRTRWSRTTRISAGLVLLLGLAGGKMLLERQHQAQPAATIDDTGGDTGGALQPAGQDGRGDTGEHAATPASATAAPEAVAPAAVAPVTVAITIASEPDGAEVFVGSEEQPRGATPLTLALARSEERVAITLKRRGYEDHVQEIIPRQDSQRTWRLARTRAKQRPPRQRAGGDDSQGVGSLRLPLADDALAPREADSSAQGIDEHVTLDPEL